MQVKGNSVYITRGEAFTYDIEIVNADGSPFVISRELVNPAWRFTIASERYSEAQRIVFDAKMAIPEPTFYCTEAIKIDAFDNNFSIHSLPADMQQDVYDHCKDAEGSVHVGWYAVYYTEVAGVKTYKYWTDTEWKDYNCYFTIYIDTDVTINMTEQSYLYQLLLCDNNKGDASTTGTIICIIVKDKIYVSDNLDIDMLADLDNILLNKPEEV